MNKVVDMASKLADKVMPGPYEDYPEDGAEVGAAQAQPQAEQLAGENEAEVLQVANGAPEVDFGGSTTSAPQEGGSFVRGRYVRHGRGPQLTVHTTKVGHLEVHVYAPSNFDQVMHIADDLKAGRATVVNYEKLEIDEQRRICDFVNGAAYVLDATPKRVSNQIVVYVPRGVEIETVKAGLAQVMPD